MESGDLEQNKIRGADEEAWMREKFEEILELRRAWRRSHITGVPIASPADARNVVLDDARLLVDVLLDPLFRGHWIEIQTETRSKPEAEQPSHARHLIRRFIAEMISRSGVVPSSFRPNLSHSLRALNYGEVWNLLHPAPRTGWHRPYTTMIMRCYAVLHVHYLWGSGEKKDVARMLVAEKFGVDRSTIRKWEQTEEFNEFQFGKDTVKHALRLGRSVKSGHSIEMLFHRDPEAHEVAFLANSDRLDNDAQRYRDSKS